MRKFFLTICFIFLASNCFGATQLLKTICPSGCDYTSLESCMNANEQNLVSADQYFDVKISGDWSGGADTTNVTIHNYTTDSTRYVNIYTTGLARHSGNWTSTAFTIEETTTFALAIDSQSQYVTIDGVQIDIITTDSSNYIVGINTQASNMTVKNCIVRMSSSGLGISGFKFNNGGTHWNNIAYSSGGADDSNNTGFLLAAGSLNIYNSVAASSGVGFSAGASWAQVKNCYAGNNTNDFTGSYTGTTNASSDGSEGTTLAYSTASGAHFTNVTPGSEDFHITSTLSGLYNAGTDLSGTFIGDIDNDARSGAWDIGVDEYVSDGTFFENVTLQGVTLQ